MPSEKEANGAPFNRGTGLLVIEVRNSNPNGDPDVESEPRTFQDERGLISPVSFKRKLRDLVANKDGAAWSCAKEKLGLEGQEDKRRILLNTRRGLDCPTTETEVAAAYHILETRFRERDEIKVMNAATFAAAFWDARIFGNTFLESLKDGSDNESDESKDTKSSREKARKKRESRDHFISTGVVQFGPGVSVAPVDIVRTTFTNKAGVETEKDQGMAPLSWRVVRHGVYALPFFVNPCAATKTGCGLPDVKLMQFLIPYAYRLTASVSRSHVEILHAWFAEHKSPLGSCPDYFILDAMTPKKIKGNPEEPSASIGDYHIPNNEDLDGSVRNHLTGFEDLCTKQWG
jgi:CRISPR-associated protein Csd2